MMAVAVQSRPLRFGRPSRPPRDGEIRMLFFLGDRRRRDTGDMVAERLARPGEIPRRGDAVALAASVLRVVDVLWTTDICSAAEGEWAPVVFVSIREEPHAILPGGGRRPRVPPEIADRLNGPASGLETSVRLGNCLERAGFRWVGQIVARTEREMLVLPSFGKRTLRELSALLAEIGLGLGMDVGDWRPPPAPPRPPVPSYGGDP
jgi:hypothetical protein